MKGGSTRRSRLPFRLGNLGTRSFRKFMRKIGQRGGQATPGSTPSVTPRLATGIIKVPAGLKGTGFDFSKAVSTLPPTFGTLVTNMSTSTTQTDPSEFTINLAQTYSRTNMPAFFITGYIYIKAAGTAPARYLNVQRQFGIQTSVSAAEIAIDNDVKNITIRNLTKASNFPYTGNDPEGYALYIIFQIFN